MERSCATVAAIAVVSAVNSPLWLRVYAEDEEPLRLHSLVHCALDSTDERLAAPKKDAASVEAYLGLLSPADEYFTYGYAACSRVKFLLVTDSEEREADVRDAFKRIHAAYVEAVSNPFQAPGELLTSTAFGRAMDALATTLRRPR